MHPTIVKRTSVIGGSIALLIIGGWVASLVALLAMPFDPWLVVPGAAWMTFLSTGLFITAHDAMHGTLAPTNRRLNHALGRLAVTLYALFSYAKLVELHRRHHAHPASGDDPDYHDGEHPGFWRWYLHFVRGYVGVGQLVGMAVAFNVLSHGVGVAEPKLFAFWVVPVLLSTLQLFTFGTYLPHRGMHAEGDRHRARSNDFGVLLSFLTCYHFGYHREHHEAPHVPWWRLPAQR